MFNLICLAALVAFVVGMVCMFTTDVENQDRADARAAVARTPVPTPTPTPVAPATDWSDDRAARYHGSHAVGR